MKVDVATAAGHPWRFKILEMGSEGPVSVSGFIEVEGGEMSTISRHFRKLIDWGYLELVGEMRGGPRRGGIERFYRSRVIITVDSP